MIGGSRIPIKDRPTRKLIGVGSGVALMTVVVIFGTVRAAFANPYASDFS